MVEQDNSDSLIIAATNHVGLLDRALFRRFDDIIQFALPDLDRIRRLLRSKLSGIKAVKIRWAAAAKEAQGLSFADVVRAAEDAIKDAVVHEKDVVTQAGLMAAIRERQASVSGKEANP